MNLASKESTLPQPKNDKHSLLLNILRSPLSKGILLASFFYISVFQFIVFTLSPKKEAMRPHFFFLGSILNTYDIEKVAAKTPSLDNDQILSKTIAVPNNRDLEHEKYLLSQKPIFAQTTTRAHQKRNPPFYFFPLNQDEPTPKEDVANNNVHQHVPLSLSDDSTY